MNQDVSIRCCGLVLAAGKGTRMHSNIPKVLHKILGEPILWYVYNGLKNLFDDKDIYFVLGHGAEIIEKEFSFVKENIIYQKEQLGTGHALQCAYETLVKRGYEYVLIVNGDVPLTNVHKVQTFLKNSFSEKKILSFMTIVLDNPTGYGRVVRDHSNKVKKIVEQKDISNETIASIKEVNAGIYVINLPKIKNYLFRLQNNNNQKEYYLPDLVQLLIKDGHEVFAFNVGKGSEFLGINTPRDLIFYDDLFQREIVNYFIDKGVVIYNSNVVRIGPKVKIDPGVQICGPVEIYGESVIKKGVCISSHVFIKDSLIEQGAVVLNFSHVEGGKIGPNSKVGPYARLRPETILEQDVKVGNFVEVKKSYLAKGVKASHLSYLGDSEIGEDTNIGAGTITCNYDGKNKHKTIIGKQVFVGSNTALVAPVKIGDGALIGAGSTITKDVPENALAVARERQKNLKKRM